MPAYHQDAEYSPNHIYIYIYIRNATVRTRPSVFFHNHIYIYIKIQIIYIYIYANNDKIYIYIYRVVFSNKYGIVKCSTLTKSCIYAQNHTVRTPSPTWKKQPAKNKEFTKSYKNALKPILF